MNSAALRRNPMIPLAVISMMALAVWLVFNVEKYSFLLFALVYACVFWTIAWKYPAATMVLIFSIAPFQNDLGRGGLRFSLAEIHIGLLLPIVLIRCYMERRPFHVGVTLIPVLLYFAVCIYASLFNYLGRSTIVSIAQMAIYLLVVVGIFCSYPKNAESFRPALYGLLVVCCFIGLWSIGTRNNYFLGLGKNGVGQSISCAFIVALELWFASTSGKVKQYLALVMGILAVALIFSVSRGAWMGCFVGSMLICGLRKQYKLMFRAALVLIPILMIAFSLLPESTKEYAFDFSPNRFNISERYKFIDTAKGLWEASPIYGSGIGLRKQYDATNVVWSTLAESGVLGLLALILIHVVFFAMILRTYRHLQKNSIQFSVLLIGGAEVLRHLTHGMVDHYWSRGAVTIAWASAGMAAYSFYVVQSEKRKRSYVAKDRELARATGGDSQFAPRSIAPPRPAIAAPPRVIHRPRRSNIGRNVGRNTASH